MNILRQPAIRALRSARAWLLAILALASGGAQAVAVPATVPAAYSFSSVADALYAGSYKNQYVLQNGSVAAAITDQGYQLGYWAGTDGHLHTYSLIFGSNPLQTVLYTQDFVAASGGHRVCFWIFCTNELAYGVRVDSYGLSSVYVDTPVGTSLVSGSLPLLRFPGNFVKTNAAGIIASTQVSSTAQFGVVIKAGTPITISDVPWLVAINDNTVPQVLGAVGDDGSCFIYGDGCPVGTCVFVPGVDTHDNDRGVGHTTHGNGKGYGHYKCDGVPMNGNNLSSFASMQSFLPSNGALMLQVNADNSISRYTFPDTLGDGSGGQVGRVFPLALNKTMAILRADLFINNTLYDRRLVSCAFSAASIDANADGVVDCIGGLQVVGGSTGTRVTTVLGFSLNDAGALVGNYGYNVSGVGTPLAIDLSAASPGATMLSNLSSGDTGWELHSISDNNSSGQAVGYGLHDCGTRLEATLLRPAAAPAVAAPRFVYGLFEQDTLHRVGETVAITPVLTDGASGSYVYTVMVKKPSDPYWQPVPTGIATTGTTYTAGNYAGDLCFRIDARDRAAPTAVQTEVVRHRFVSSLPTVNPYADLPPLDVRTTIPASSLVYDPTLLAAAGALAPAALVLLLVAGACRQRAKRR